MGHGASELLMSLDRLFRKQIQEPKPYFYEKSIGFLMFPNGGFLKYENTPSHFPYTPSIGPYFKFDHQMNQSHVSSRRSAG